MREYFSKKIKKSTRTFDDAGVRAKEIVRRWNMAKRMDLGHKKGEIKKKKSK
ncbi:MAG: hypothetical protein AAB340_00975 [Patescibacteria group bacterium]